MFGKGFSFFPFFFSRSVFCKHALHNFFLCIHTHCKRGRAISALPPKSLMDCIDKYLARDRGVVVSGAIMTTRGDVVHSMD